MAKKKNTPKKRVTHRRSIGMQNSQYAKDKKDKAAKLSQAGRNPDGSFKKGNPFQFKHGNTVWKTNELLGRNKYFEDPQVLLEAFQEYMRYVDETPWIKKELVKGGDLAGMVMDVETQRPYTLDGFIGYVGLSSSWLYNLEKRLRESDTEADRVYGQVLEIIRNTIRDQKFNGAAVGAFNATIIARDIGLAEKVDTTLKDEREKAADIFPFEDDDARLKAKKEADKKNK